jgi:hypothetical protein
MHMKHKTIHKTITYPTFFLDCLIHEDGTDRLSQKSVNDYRYALDNRSEDLVYTKVEA